MILKDLKGEYDISLGKYQNNQLFVVVVEGTVTLKERPYYWNISAYAHQGRPLRQIDFQNINPYDYQK